MPLQPGRYRVSVYGLGFVFLGYPVEVFAGTTVELDVPLRPGLRHPVPLALPDGVERARFVVRAAESGIVLDESRQRGVTEITPAPFLAPGRYDVEVSAESGDRWEASFTVAPDDPADAPIRFTLQKR